MTIFSFWNAKSWFLLSLGNGGGKNMKSSLPSLSLLQKERLIFSIRFQIMKGGTSLADVLCFHRADSYLLGFICQQISTMWQKYTLQPKWQADQILWRVAFPESFVDGVQTAKLHIRQSEITLSPTLLITENKHCAAVNSYKRRQDFKKNHALHRLTRQALGWSFYTFLQIDVLKTTMLFILHKRADDIQTVTNASKLTVQETHSARQPVQNRCLCNQKTMDRAALYSILMCAWLALI